MKRVGPELKMPEMKVPPLVNDFYQDLRDRRLLPVIALVIVGIVAVPFLLGESKQAEVPPATSEALAKASSSADQSSKLVVVRSTPGLREYRKRLKGNQTDPFKQRLTAPVVAEDQLGESGSEGESAPTVSTTTVESAPSTFSPSPEPSPPVSTPSPSPSPSPSSPPQHIDDPGKAHLTFYAWTINVKITKQDGSASSSDAAKDPKSDSAKDSKDEGTVRKEVMPQTALPGEKAPVVTYMGASTKKPGRAVLLVSSNVKSIFGETTCSNKTEDVCQLIEVEPGFPVTLVYGYNEVRYTVNVLKLELVALKHS